jgi:hypothetical protein
MPQQYNLGPINNPIDGSWILQRVDDGTEMSVAGLFGIRDAVLRYLWQNTNSGQDANRALLITELAALGIFGSQTGSTGASGPDITNKLASGPVVEA